MSNVVVTTNPAPVVNSNQVQPPPHPAQKYANKFRNLGITQVVIGVLCILFAIAIIVLNGGYYGYTYGYYYFYLAIIGAGIWGGAFTLIAGILGIVSGKNVNSCKVTGSMIMAIFAAIAAGGMFAIETSAAVSLQSFTPHPQAKIYATHIVVAILAFVELIVSIVHSAYCCAGGCCASTTGRVMPPGQTIVTTTAYPNQIPVSNIQGSGYEQPNQGFIGDEDPAQAQNPQEQAPEQEKGDMALSQPVGQQQEQPPQNTEKSTC